ncbi:MAG TPA: hypothetical protein PK185_11625 [Cyclobacteriaceae bacterium]|nr:hypothetical protein [Cyclobacteriaceae bacterium]
MKTLKMITKEKKSASHKMIWVAIGLLALIFTSCNENNIDADTSIEDQESVEFDNQGDYYLDDVDEMTSIQLEKETGSSGGKISEEPDGRLSCAQITRTGTEESGTIVIDFGEGCTGPRGNVRKGKLVIDYSGRRNNPGSFWTVEFEDYFINNISIKGLRTVNNISENGTGVLVFKVDMVNVLLTWPDGKQGKRTVHRIREHHLGDNNLLDRLIVYGTAEGNHRNGRGYFIEIIEPLVYTRECKQQGIFIPVEGVKSIKHGNRQITVDYGDGECDNIVVITNTNGKSWRHEVGN